MSQRNGQKSRHQELISDCLCHFIQCRQKYSYPSDNEMKDTNMFFPLVIWDYTSRVHKYFSSNACWNCPSQVMSVIGTFHTLCSVGTLVPHFQIYLHPCNVFLGSGERGLSLPFLCSSPQNSSPSCPPCSQISSPKLCSKCIAPLPLWKHTQNTILPTMPSEQTPSCWGSAAPLFLIPASRVLLHVLSNRGSPCFLNTHALCSPASVPSFLLLLQQGTPSLLTPSPSANILPFGKNNCRYQPITASTTTTIFFYFFTLIRKPLYQPYR